MFEIIEESNKTIFKIKTDLVAAVVEEIKTELKELLQKNEDIDLIIDFEEVRMLDSMGLGVLITAHNSLQEKGKALEIRNANKDITNLFNTMRLNQHFKIA